MAPRVFFEFVIKIFFKLEEKYLILKFYKADVAELVDALDLGSSGATRGSSSLFVRTNRKRQYYDFKLFTKTHVPFYRHHQTFFASK
jgi:hypothetical protein